METARAAAGAREVLSAGRLRDASVDNAVDVAKAGGSRMTMLASYRNGAVTHVLGAAKGAGVGVVVLCYRRSLLLLCSSFPPFPPIVRSNAPAHAPGNASPPPAR